MVRTIMIVGVLLLTGLSACSRQDDNSGEAQHPWKDQEKALNKAKQVEQDMLDAFKQRDREMEKQTQ